MNDRIKKMALEAGIDLDPHGGINRAYDEHLAKFAQLVAEDCAKVCSARGAKFYAESPFSAECHGLSDAIRARYGLT